MYFRESGGLHIVRDMLKSVTNKNILPSVMFALGCAAEKNGNNLSELLKTVTPQLFLHKILSHE